MISELANEAAVSQSHQLEPISSHIDTLPYDLLSHIFIFCFLNHGSILWHSGPCARPSTKEAPLLLMRVCRAWRDCALSTPLLWSGLIIRRHRRTLAHFKAAKEWLARAGSMPLSIDLSYTRFQGERVQADAALADIFVPSRVWKAVFLNIQERSRSPCVDSILNVVLKNAPELEKFAFSVNGIEMEENLLKFGVGQAPKLTVLSLITNSCVNVSLENNQFYAIRDLRLQFLDCSHDCLDVLDRCPLVEVLHVSIKGTNRHHTREASIRTLAHLRIFIVLAQSEADVASLLDRLITPVLTDFSMDHNKTTVRPTSWPHLARLLARSQPPLMSLSLVNLPTLEDNIIECLLHVPTLTNLSGDGWLFRSAVVEKLTPCLDPIKVPLCPNISTIKFTGVNVNLAAAPEMIRERWTISRQTLSEPARKANLNVVAPAWIEVGRMDAVHFRECPGIQECEKEGMVIWST